MSEKFSFDPSRTAVLSMDNQAGIVSVYAEDQEAFLARTTSVLERARSLAICVIHIQVGFRPGLPEVSSRNPLFGAIKSSSKHQQFFEGASGAIHPRLGPLPGDIVITKHRVSGFYGTDLDMILRAKEIDTLILFGIATSGVVLSTVLDATDMDYRVVVLKDCCADTDEELHACLLDKLFVRRATVISSTEFLEAIGQGPIGRAAQES